MRLIEKAAITGFAALMLTSAAGPAGANHDNPFFSRRGPDWNVQQNRPPRQDRQRRQGWQGWQGWPGWQSQQPQQSQQVPPRAQRGGGFFGWAQPQPQYQPDPSQNIEPEPETTTENVIYTYRADPLVALGDPDLSGPGLGRFSGNGSSALIDGEVLRRRSGDPLARTVFNLLKSQTTGVRVTDQQRKAIVGFYRERSFAPLWVSANGVSPRARDLVAKLSKAAEEGLKPEDYLPPEMTAFSDDPASFAGDPERLARLDLGLTAAALRYAMHASGGRIIPNRISGYHDLNPPVVKPGEALERLASDADPAAYLGSLHPTHPAYRAFTRELAELRAEAEGRNEQPIAEGPSIKLGQSDVRLPAIRGRLASLGYLAQRSAQETGSDEDIEPPLFGSADDVVTIQPVVAQVPASDVLDDATVEALKSFQSAAGLTPDGVVGPKTLAALNADTAGQRIQRLVFNIERLRWLPRDLGAKHVLANQAAFELQVVEDGATVWRTKIIVGKPETQTAFFSDVMETVVINPYWGVPGSIIVNEMLPELYRDPSYLDREGYEVTDLSGRVIPSSSVDWYRISRSNLPVGVRQPPGPSNALGEIKFLFPNKHSIYMHDTPSKPLFSKPVRAFSHGCVRVENPRRFAEIILGWDQDRVASEIAGRDNQSVTLDRKVPVHLTYFTAWPDDKGGIRYFDDIYGRDELLDRAFGTLTLAMR